MIVRILPGLVLLLSVSCAAAPDPGIAQLQALDARHRAELSAFQAEQRRVVARRDLLTPLDFGGDGQLLLRDAGLIGWPGAAYMRVEFTYVNSGARTSVAPQVTLAVGDPATGESVSTTQDLTLPFGLSLGNDSTYSSWIEVTTDGLEMRPGWQWDIRVEPRGQ